MISSTQQPRERPKKRSLHAGKSRYRHFLFPKLQDCRFKNPRTLGCTKGGIPGNPELRNPRIAVTNSNTVIFYDLKYVTEFTQKTH